MTALCAPCHSRRAQFADPAAPGGELLDAYLPTLLAPGTFHADGQILDEDFEWHAFTQSKMHANGVRCSDCHDVHSGKRHKEGNELCTRCHRADTYDAASHTFHKAEWKGKPSAGVRCVSCHMPGQDFMVVHFRRDHSMRVPRPDLTASHRRAQRLQRRPGATPTSRLSWVQATLRRLVREEAQAPLRDRPRGGAGPSARGRGRTRPARRRTSSARGGAGHRGRACWPATRARPARAAIEKALSDPEPLVRVTAVQRVTESPTRRGWRGCSGRSSRIRSAGCAPRRRRGWPAHRRGASPRSQRKAWAAALDEYEAGQRYMSDLPVRPVQPGQPLRGAGANGRRREAVPPGAGHRRPALPGPGQPGHVARGEWPRRGGRDTPARGPRPAAPARRHRLQPGAAAGRAGTTAPGPRRCCARRCAADPRLAPAAFNLAVLVGERKPAEAVPLARTALALRPDDARYAWTLGFYQARAGDLDGAAGTLDALLRGPPGVRGDHARCWPMSRPGRAARRLRDDPRNALRGDPRQARGAPIHDPESWDAAVRHFRLAFTSGRDIS